MPFCLTHYKRFLIANRCSTSLFPMFSYSFFRSKHKVAEYKNASLHGFEKASIPNRSDLLCGVSESTLIKICKLWCFTLLVTICIFEIVFTLHCNLKICIFSFMDFYQIVHFPKNKNSPIFLYQISIWLFLHAAHFSSKKF